MRLDQAIVKLNLVSTRSLAQDYIKEGFVEVNGKKVVKPSYATKETDTIILLQRDTFASRGGSKLYHALHQFDIALTNAVVLDVGASTGGFSDVCLRLGATYVYAVDVGHDQLSQTLQMDKRVVNMEGTHAKDLKLAMFQQPIDFVCMDVSFISIRLLFPSIMNVVNAPCQLVLLIKPQFEVGKQHINKQGVVRDKRIHKQLLETYIEYFETFQLGVVHIAKSTITGRTGNQEYFIHLTSECRSKQFDIAKIIE